MLGGKRGGGDDFARGALLFLTFNEVGERGVCIGVPRRLTATPYRG